MKGITMGTVQPSAGAKLPVACTLGAADAAARLRRWQLVSEKSPPTMRRSANTLEVSWRLAPGVKSELEELAAAERDCCSFLGWELSSDDGVVVLRITADPDSPDDLAALCALFAAG
jgi:hypothetical protein